MALPDYDTPILAPNLTDGLRAWRSAALPVLRKAGVATESHGPQHVEALLSSTVDGLTVRPLYTAADTVPASGFPGRPPYARGSALPPVRGRWEIRQRYTSADPEAVRADLAGGADAVWLVTGADAIDPGDLPELLKMVPLDRVPVVVDGPGADVFLKVLDESGVAPEAVRGGLTSFGPGAARYPGLLRVIDATGRPDDLAYALSAGVAALRELDGDFERLEFRYEAGPDVFETIAKLRAARVLWSRVAELCGAAGAPGQRQHAVVTEPGDDPWVDLVRGTLACFGAAAGGAPAITTTAASRRTARDLQLILIEEASALRVVDPAGGSWYAESRTADLARAAWQAFTAAEREAGR